MTLIVPVSRTEALSLQGPGILSLLNSDQQMVSIATGQYLSHREDVGIACTVS